MLEDVLLNHDCREVSAMECYSMMFRLGEGLIQRENDKSGDTFKTKPIIYMKNHSEEHGHYRLLFEDTFQEILESSYDFDFAITNGLTYFGRKMETAKASKMFALIVDLDGVTDKTLSNFIEVAKNKEYKHYPLPNYIKLSGNNVHLVYIFERPLSLYPNTKHQLKQLKYALIRKVWNPYTSTIEQPQFQSINQGFRPIGAKTKIDGVRVRCFKTEQPFWTIEQLNEYIPEEFRVDLASRYAASTMTFEQAKLQFPEWAESIENNPRERKKKHWNVSRNLYEWSKRRVYEDAVYHHRYFGMMLIAICGVKCSYFDEKKNPNPVTKEEVEKDLFELKPYLTSINPQEPITDSDIKSALDAFDPAYITFPREDIERLTAISMPPQKRNYRKQKDHLARIRVLQNYDDPQGQWRNKEGAPTKKELVQRFIQEHPSMNNSEIAVALGISRSTVIKWKNDLKNY